MRTPKYLSPTSISLWGQDRTEFYFRYLADDRPERMLQTRPMSVGSAFDAYVKSELTQKLFGTTDVSGVDHSFSALFEKQVDAHNRDWALVAGREAMALYRCSGALADLVLELESAIEDPRFEFSVEGRVPHEKVVDGVTLLGRPDLFFRTKNGAVVIDWKVNGWCSTRAPSPVKGYIKCRSLKKGRFVNKVHKDAHVMMVDGMMIDIVHTMDELSIPWARQLSIYAWVLGVEVGGDFIIGIDQLVGRDRVSTLRNKVGRGFQRVLLDDIVDIWCCILTGHIFDGTREESDARIKMLDDYADGYRRDATKWAGWLEGILRS